MSKLDHYPWHVRDDISQARRVWIDYVTAKHGSNSEHERAARRWWEAVNLVAGDLDLNWADARAVILCQTNSAD